MFSQMLGWWYSAGLKQAWRAVMVWPRRALKEFSVPLLIRTLFAPWKRITSGGGRGLDAKMRAMVDNLVSRVVGFSVRVLVLITAGFLSLFAFIGAVVAAVAWPFVPLAIIYFLFRSIVG
ncbi:MAG: hypothetical protein ACREGA_01635 [Candidatus Saccharimonadales bacterium]